MKFILILVLVSLNYTSMYSQVGIGTTTPHTTAILDINSEEKGFLPPRLNSEDRDLIQNPATGLTIYNISTQCLQWFNGTYWHDACDELTTLKNRYPIHTNFCGDDPTVIFDVQSPVTGDVWMDRNLGAQRAATSPDDFQAYGHFYQWGRFSEGHQCIHWIDETQTDGQESTQEIDGNIASNRPLNATDSGDWDGKFIRRDSGDNNWLSNTSGNADVWNSGTDLNPERGTTDPCPNGYRIPTQAEMEAERQSWTEAPINSTNDPTGAIDSPLKLPSAGGRNRDSGDMIQSSSSGFYFTSTLNGLSARTLGFNASGAGMFDLARANATPIRCIKNE